MIKRLTAGFTCCAIQGIKREDAARAFWLTDEHGLLTKQRKEEGLSDVAQFFSREADHGDKEGEKLIDTIKRVRFIWKLC
jgi:hypothetical protein